MSKLALNDLRTEDVQLTLMGETFTLRKFTLDDEAWLKDSFTAAELTTLFTDKMTDIALARIAFHQMPFEDQKRIGTFPVRFIHEDTGKEVLQEVGGWRALRHKVSGMNEKLALFRGVMTTIGMSRGTLEKIFTAEELAEYYGEPADPSQKKKKARKAIGRKR